MVATALRILGELLSWPGAAAGWGKAWESPSPAWEGVQPFAGCDLLCVFVGSIIVRCKKGGGKASGWGKSSHLQVEQLFQSLSHSFILMGNGDPPPPAPHCLPMQLQAPPRASHIPALHFSISAEGGKATQTTKKKNHPRVGCLESQICLQMSLGAHWVKKRACLVNPISLPQ